MTRNRALLTIKGTQEQAQTELLKVIGARWDKIEVWSALPDSTAFVVTMASNMAVAEYTVISDVFNDWFLRDMGVEAPYEPGALMWWRWMDDNEVVREVERELPF